MYRFPPLFYALCALILCANFGSNSSEQGPKKPSYCVYGTLTTTNNEKQAVKNLLVGGIFDRIPFYGVTLSEDIDPTTNVTFLDLDEIISIKPSAENPLEGIKRYKNRDYIALTITLKGNEKGLSSLVKEPQEKKFLVERGRKISCDQTATSGDFEREVSFEAIKELSILGFRQGERQNSQKEQTKESPSAAKEALCAQTKTDLQQLDTESKGVFSTMIQKIRSSVNYICG